MFTIGSFASDVARKVAELTRQMEASERYEREAYWDYEHYIQGLPEEHRKYWWAQRYWIHGPIFFGISWLALFLPLLLAYGMGMSSRSIFVPFLLLFSVGAACLFNLFYFMVRNYRRKRFVSGADWEAMFGYPFFRLGVCALFVMICASVTEITLGSANGEAVAVAATVISLAGAFFWEVVLLLRVPKLGKEPEDVESAKSNSPKFKSWQRQQRVLSRLREEIQNEKRRLTQRIAELQALKPATALGFAERGRDFMEVGLLDEALVNIDAAILMDPDCAEAHLWKGMVQAAQKKEAPKQT